MPNASPRRASDDEINAALLVLEQEGAEALDLAHIARRLGRSGQGGAASLPWPNLKWLRSELAALGFRRLRAAIAEQIAALAPGADGPVDKTMAAGRAYVRNAVRSPALFALMHQPELVDFTHPELSTDANAGYSELRDRVARLQASGFEPERDVDELSRMVWDGVHRVAQRWAEAALDGPVDAATIDEAIDLEFTLLLGDAPTATTGDASSAAGSADAHTGRPARQETSS